MEAVGNDGGGVGQLMDPKMKKSALFSAVTALTRRNDQISIRFLFKNFYIQSLTRLINFALQT